MSVLCINKSGSVYPVYDMFKNYAHVGDIMNREAFVRRSGDSGLIRIDFLGPTQISIHAAPNLSLVVHHILMVRLTLVAEPIRHFICGRLKTPIQPMQVFGQQFPLVVWLQLMRPQLGTPTPIGN